MKKHNNIDFDAFFKAHRQEIPDHGFSRKVMHSLPQRTTTLSRLWSAVCLSIGILLFWIYDGMLYLQIFLNDFFNTIFKTVIRDSDPVIWGVVVVVMLGTGFYRILSVD